MVQCPWRSHVPPQPGHPWAVENTRVNHLSCRGSSTCHGSHTEMESTRKPLRQPLHSRTSRPDCPWFQRVHDRHDVCRTSTGVYRVQTDPRRPCEVEYPSDLNTTTPLKGPSVSTTTTTTDQSQLPRLLSVVSSARQVTSLWSVFF